MLNCIDGKLFYQTLKGAESKRVSTIITSGKKAKNEKKRQKQNIVSKNNN